MRLFHPPLRLSIFYGSRDQPRPGSFLKKREEPGNEVVPCLVLPCLVLSCLVLSCLVLSCLVLSCLVLSCLVLSCLVLSCLVLSCLVLSCLVFVFSEVGPKFACWFVCNVNVEWSEESSCHF